MNIRNKLLALLPLALALPFASAQSRPSSSDASGPYAYWSFDKPGKDIYTATGSAPDYLKLGSLAGVAAPVAGVKGQSLRFSEEPLGHLTLPIDLSLAPGGVYSLELWLRPGPATRDYGTIIDAGGFRGFSIRIGTRRRVSASLDEKWNLLHAESPLIDDVWTHIAATFDGAVFRLFVDGREAGQHTITTVPRLALGLELGAVRERHRLADGVVEDILLKPLVGDIDEVKIYHRVLTPAEIAEAAKITRPRN
jgi:hypothetical protein